MTQAVSLKSSLILLTLISVICDTMLLPFYPRFFLERFAIDSSAHVGAYIAACCFTVMCAFPLWAKIAKRVHEIQLWIATQLCAAALGIACFYTTDLISFWLLSQAMLVFKASYLLIYPFVLKLESKQSHLGIVGLFSVLMHFGGIGGALLGGWMLDKVNAEAIFLVMAVGDLAQVSICIYLSARLSLSWQLLTPIAHRLQARKGPRFVYVIGIVSLCVYFSAFLARPYFTLYWQQISQLNSEVLAGLMYAIPAWVALACLYFTHKRPQTKLSHQLHIKLAMLVACCGLVLQASPYWYGVLLGRIILGYAMFVVTVKLEVLLFSLSEPQHYGDDFAKVHFMQNLGVIAASFTVGSLVSNANYQLPFLVAAGGFMVSLLLAAITFSHAFQTNQQQSKFQLTASDNAVSSEV